jgi:hypothetical protein
MRQSCFSLRSQEWGAGSPSGTPRPPSPRLAVQKADECCDARRNCMRLCISSTNSPAPYQSSLRPAAGSWAALRRAPSCRSREMRSGAGARTLCTLANGAGALAAHGSAALLAMSGGNDEGLQDGKPKTGSRVQEGSNGCNGCAGWGRQVGLLERRAANPGEARLRCKGAAGSAQRQRHVRAAASSHVPTKKSHWLPALHSLGCPSTWLQGSSTATVNVA